VRYTIEILRTARKQLERVEPQDQDRLISAILALAENPRPSGSKRLSGRLAWRIRVGAYRVIYEIHNDRLMILVVAVGHRREVYR
jgi:mRNA interferase RelE/StbE